MWKKVRLELPPEGKWVLARHAGGNHYSSDQQNVNCVVVSYNGSEFETFGMSGHGEITHWMEIPPCNDYEEFNHDPANWKACSDWRWKQQSRKRKELGWSV